MVWVVSLAIVAVLIVAALFGFKKWGASDEKRERAENEVEEMEEDAEIASKPYVDKPFSGMRGKK